MKFDSMSKCLEVKFFLKAFMAKQFRGMCKNAHPLCKIGISYKICLFKRDVPINRYRHQQLSIGNFFRIGIRIGIGKIWPILADFLNIIIVLIFSHQIDLRLYFLPDKSNFLFTKTFTRYERKNYKSEKKKWSKEVFFASALLIVLLSCI